MKKIFAASAILASLVVPVAVLAIAPGTIPTPGELGIQNAGNLPKNTNDIMDKIASIVGYVYILFFIAAVLFIILAAFNYLTGGDAPAKIETAHKQLVYAVIAIVVALLSVVAQVIVSDFLGGGSNNQQGPGKTPFGVPGVDYPAYPGGSVQI